MKKEDTLKKTGKNRFVNMPILNSNAAGIDIGGSLHAVAVPIGRDDESVRTFGAMTCDLHEIANWLKKCNVDTVAMESTGVYWKPLFALLIHKGFEVYLVNAQHVRNVTGRKTDQSDAQWLQQLHSCGLLSSCYLPDAEQESLRSLVRYRRVLIRDCNRYILRIQKALALMNIKLDSVLANVMCKSGIAILEKIIAGERKAENFLPLIDKRVRAKKEMILKSLEGNWLPEHLFLLAENYKCYLFIQERITICEKEIIAQLERYEASLNEGVISPKDNITRPEAADRFLLRKMEKPHPNLNTMPYLERIFRVNVIAIYGLSDVGALEILAETGTDLSKWPTEKHFVSWLNLCPNNKVSGGKIISSKLMKKQPNMASQAFRAAANGVQKSDHWLGNYFRRMKAKAGQKYAIVATANKIATIYYKMIRNKKEFNPIDLKVYQEKYRQAKILYLEKRLQKLKFGEVSA
ncbi:IS110 family transposase [Chitinophaga sp. 22321]|uniref:IS110 family transposase n=1 Tax=Chitinophaga hostae TaxID=2831022 RepID=A0ABS5JB91_9BACT|nr:IS110 family transposase [Chitinophaga hostae]MBS0032478.1 IS110 family transposase [Chitinophaga hostae]